MLDAGLAVPIAAVTAAVFVVAGVLYARRGSGGVEGYLVARNTAGSTLATATLVASVAGAWILFSPAEAGTWAGIAAIVGYGIGQAAPLLAFIWLGPKMRSVMPEGHSLTEYVWYRYGPAMYVFTLGVIIFYMFVFLSAELTGISLALNLLADVPLLLTALIVGLLTVGYTAYGGIRASIFTDGIQFVLVIPLLLITFVALVVSVDGFGTVFKSINENETTRHLLSFTNKSGIDFGITLIIAILAANMFHQGFWQRVYTSKDDKALRRGFTAAGVVVIPMVIIGGLAGIMTVGKDLVGDNASVAMFSLIVGVLPTWAVIVVLVLALVLVMSSLDTLLNGIASVVTTDLARFKPELKGATVLSSSRAITVVLIIPAILIASQGYSVLYLFLIADMVCAAAVVPVFWGLYAPRFSGSDALTASALGLVAGILFFPTPEAPYLNGLIITIDFASQLLVSFAAALGVSIVVSLVLTALRNRPEYDFAQLREQVRLID